MIVLLLVLSFVSFLIIQLPPGDYLSTMIQNMRNLGMTVDEDMIRALEDRYSLDKPFLLQYLKWFGNLLQGDMGRSFQWNEEVTELIAERLALTVTISVASLLFVYVVAVPIDVYSATHPYSLGDYVFTVAGFIVLSQPTVGPLLLRALQAQDMYLAGSMVMLLSALAMLGTLVSDLMLVSIDPRIRFENEARA